MGHAFNLKINNRISDGQLHRYKIILYKDNCTDVKNVG